jgi:hypothetical protein
MSLIDIRRTYTTRKGTPVINLRRSFHEHYPIEGFRLVENGNPDNPNDWILNKWTDEGKYFAHKDQTPLDLIEVEGATIKLALTFVEIESVYETLLAHWESFVRIAESRGMSYKEMENLDGKFAKIVHEEE